MTDKERFTHVISFIDYLKNLVIDERNGWPLLYTHADEFRDLEMFVRRGYYGK